MTLKRLMIILGVLVFLAGIGIMWLWQYAYTPQGRARIIIAQLKNDTTSLRGWMLEYQVVRPGFPIPEDNGNLDYWEIAAASEEMFKLGREVQPIVVEAIQDDNRDVRMMAIQASGKFRDSAAIQLLVKFMLDTTRADNDKLQCLESLVEIGPEAYGPLLDASRKCDLYAMRAIPDMLAAKWGVAAVPHLIEMLEDPDEDVCWNAARDLGKLKDMRATAALVRHLNDQRGNVAYWSATALGEIGDRKTIPSLLKMLKEGHLVNRVRISNAGALARMGQDEGRDYLLTMVKSPYTGDRAEAANELGTTEIKGTLGPLLSLLGDSNDYVRERAAVAVRVIRLWARQPKASMVKPSKSRFSMTCET